MKRSSPLPLAFVLSIILLPFQSHSEESGYKIGVISALTGMAEKWDRFQNMGITLAAEELRAQGTPIELVFEDSQTKSPRAIAAFNKLIDFDKVDALIGDDFGFVMAPILPLAERRKKLLVATSLPVDTYCSSAPNYFFSITSQFSHSVDAFDQFFISHPTVKKIAFVVFDDPEWGNSYRAIWTELAKRHHVEVVDTFLSAEGIPDFKTILPRMLAKKPDALFLAHEPNSFFKALSQFRFSGVVVSANNILELYADSIEPHPELHGVYLVDPKISEEFRNKFRSRYHREPILEAYAGYEAMRTVAGALKRDRHNPQQAMKTVSYQGVAGRVDFSGKSCAGNFAEWGLFQIDSSGMPRLLSRP